MHPIYLVTVLLTQLEVLSAYGNSPVRSTSSSFRINAYKAGSFTSKPKNLVSDIDGRSIKDGSLIEYISSKGSKRLAMVTKRKGSTLDVVNNVMVEFSVSVAKVTYLIDGTFSFSDLTQLDNNITSLQLHQVEVLWKSTLATSVSSINIESISQNLFGSKSSIHLFLSINLMNQFGEVFFEKTPITDKNSPNVDTVAYTPLSEYVVANNLAHQQALEQFKIEFTKIITTQSPKNKENTNNLLMHGPALAALVDYEDGLKQLIAKGHPWTVNGWCPTKFDDKAAMKAKVLLEFLGLSPSSKSARKVLDLTGIWSTHYNIEKYIMGIRDKFPLKAIDEAHNLLENHETIPDPDALIRRDLRHLNCYSVDREGATEVDDAISVEILEDGREVLWTHISDVSRWIQPGSALCREAEKRMTSIYMPDEIISMFPADLSQQLLSLGAKECSFAFSCGVILDPMGKIVSFEVCPSIIRLSQRLTYIQLDSILGGEGPEYLGSNIPLINDITKLKHWVKLRSDFRKMKNGALDDYLQHKSDLLLSVTTENREGEGQLKTVISSEVTYSNSGSYGFVTEFMILMSETIGILSSELKAAVRYKIQSPSIPLGPEDFALQQDENVFLRSNRMVRNLKAATDSKIPAHHVTSGASTYVQCTSPIRRYPDLTNHYYIKAALRKEYSSSPPSSPTSSSVFSPYVSRSSASSVLVKSKRKSDLDDAIYTIESKIPLLEDNVSDEDKIQTLNAVRMVQRSRSQYWLLLHIKELSEREPLMEFDCMLLGSPVGKEEENSSITSEEHSLQNIMVFQLGSFKTYRLYVPPEVILKKGNSIKCNIVRIDEKSQLADYLFVPSGFDSKLLPRAVLNINNNNDSKISKN